MLLRKIMTSLSLIVFTSLVLILAGFVLVLILSDPPARATRSWQVVTIAGIGTFQVPIEWNVEEDDGVLFITNKSRANRDYTIYIVGTAVGSGIQPHEVFDGVEQGDMLLSPFFRNGAVYLLYEYIVDGTIQEHRLIIVENIRSLHERNYIGLFVWNREVVDDWTVEQIARTFRRNLDDFDNPNVGRLMP